MKQKAMEKKLNPWLVIFAATLGYYALAKAGLMLIIPPGYASPIWPAAGFSLAFVLHYGPVAAVGTFIGSMLANDGVEAIAALLSGSPINKASLAIAMGIGIGAALQALTASLLIRRRFQWPLGLTDDLMLLKFLFIVILPTHVISPLVGSLALCFVGQIPWPTFWYSVVIWWVGDCFGSVMFFPLIWCLWGTPRELWKKRAHYLPPIVLSFLLVFAFIHNTSSQRHLTVLKESYVKLISQNLHVLNVRFDSYEDRIHGVVNGITAIGYPTTEQFEILTDSIARENPEVNALSWLVIFDEKDRMFWQERVNELLPGAKIRALPNTAVAVDSLERHAVVLQITPASKRTLAVGIDLMTKDTRAVAIAEVVAKKQPLVSSSAVLATTPPQEGVLVFYPVARDIEHSIVNLVLGVYTFEKTFSPILENLPPEIGFSIYDTIGENKEIYHRGPAIKDWAAGFYWENELELFDHRYLVKAAIPAAYFYANPSLDSWLIMIIGLLLATAICAFVLSATNRENYLRHQITQQIAEIDESRVRAMESSKLASLGMMAAGLAHEINNPLSIIQGYCFQIRRLIGGEGVVNSKLEVLAGGIETTVLRIATIIQALRSYSRHDHEDPLEEVDLNDLLHETAALCADQFNRAQVVLSMPDKDIELPKLLGRKGSLMQVLLNLMNNAKDALQPTLEKQVWVKVEAKGDHIEIHIQDNGPGVPASIASRIMDPFFTTKPPGVGTGLGLSVCAHLMNEMGGSIELASNQNPTTFVLRLKKAA